MTSIYKYIGFTIWLIGIGIWITSNQFSSMILYIAQIVTSFNEAFAAVPPLVAGAWVALPLIIALAIYTIFF